MRFNLKFSIANILNYDDLMNYKSEGRLNGINTEMMNM